MIGPPGAMAGDGALLLRVVLFLNLCGFKEDDLELSVDASRPEVAVIHTPVDMAALSGGEASHCWRGSLISA